MKKPKQVNPNTAPPHEFLKYVDELETYANKLEEQSRLYSVSERFSSEGEILQWLYLNMPFAIKPKSKQAKTLLVNPFTSNHAFEAVCKHTL